MSTTPLSSQKPSPKSKKHLFGAGALVAGLVAGTLLAPVGSAGAQEADADPAQDRSSTPERFGPRQDRGEALEALGLDAETIRAGFEADQTLVEIAEANGVSEAELIEAIESGIEARLAEAVANGFVSQERADEKRATLTETITTRVNTPPSERPERPRRIARARFLGEALGDLGLTIDDVREGREAGQTLAETAAASGISEDELVDALVANASERVDAAIERGRLDADAAAERLADLEERIIDRLNAEPGE